MSYVSRFFFLFINRTVFFSKLRRKYGWKMIALEPFFCTPPTRKIEVRVFSFFSIHSTGDD